MSDQRPLHTAAENHESVPETRVVLCLLAALLAGIALRQWSYNHTGTIRFELNQQNAFYWGNRIVQEANAPGSQGTSRSPGAAPWGALLRSYRTIYDADAAHPAPQINTLDYVPLRLLMAGVWVNYLNIAYGPVTEWRPEFARSFAAFSMVMELAGSAAMFALVACWLKRAGVQGVCSWWGRWEQASAAAILVWLNPASIVDSHVWPHGQTWILPFYLCAVLAMVNNRFLLAGVIFGIGAMFKGQMMLVAPVLILWPMFDRRWLAALRVALGMVGGVGAVVWPWLIRGSTAWVRAGFASNGMYSDVLRKGQALNLPALLAHRWNMTLHQRLADHTVLGLHIGIELRSLLMVLYAILLVCCSWGIARQARSGDRRLLISIAAPWAIMFFVLGQMDERYLVWSACFSAGAVAVGWSALGAHAMLTWAGAATMIEFLLICKPDAAPTVLHTLAMLNPLTWIVTAVAVMLLVVGTFRRIRVARSVAEEAAALIPIKSAAIAPLRSAA